MAARRLGGGSAVRRPGREERLEKLLLGDWEWRQGDGEDLQI